MHKVGRSWRHFAAGAVLVSAIAAPLKLAADPSLPLPPTSDWVSTAHRDHPLAGKIWSVRDAREVSSSELAASLAMAKFLLLGEVHDNPDHHRLQGWAIAAADTEKRKSGSGGTRPIGRVAMEMVSTDQQYGLLAFANLADEQRTPNNFGRLIAWDRSGWPDFGLYEPIIAAALAAGAPIVPATAGSEQTRAVSRDGTDSLGPDRVAELALDRPLEAELSVALGVELRESHCGMLPEAALPKMAIVQQFRDAIMADALLAVSPAQAAVLIAGNGHVRRDRGVPRALVQRGVSPDTIVTVMNVEIDAERLTPDQYTRNTVDEAASTDFIWFTPRLDRPDPCEKMKQHMENKRG